MIKFTSKNGHMLKAYENQVHYLRKWRDIHDPEEFNACLDTDLCEYETCTFCPYCLNYKEAGYTQKEKMEAIQELFDKCCNRSIRGNTIIGMPKPILFKELEK